jgi:hypothetical protein
MKTLSLKMTQIISSLFRMTIILIMAHSTTTKVMEGLSTTTNLSTSTIATITFTMMEEPEAIVITCVKTHITVR